MAVELERGDTVYGMLDAAPDSLSINIDSIFLNQISAERIGGLCAGISTMRRQVSSP